MQSKRQTFNNKNFDEVFGRKTAKPSKWKYIILACIQTHCLQVWMNILPFTHVLRHYYRHKWKNWFVGDLLGGLSCGVMQVPQGMGVAAMVGLPAYFGLYTSFFPAAVYFLFGSSRHVSVGVVGVITGMVLRIVTKHLQDCIMLSMPNSSDPNLCSYSRYLMTTNDTNINVSITLMPPIDSEKEAIIGIVAAMQCIVGLILIGMFLLRLGILGHFVSHSFNSALQTAAGLLATVSQIAPALGYQSPGFFGVWNLPNQLTALFQNIFKTNAADAIVAVLTIIGVLILREFVNVKFEKKFKHPIPAELAAMIVGTIISYFAELNRRFGLAVIGYIPRGFFTPTFPILVAKFENKYMLTTRTQFQLKYDFVFDCLALAIVIYGVTITLSKALARKHRYVLDNNQELLAYGLSHFVSSFFYCFPVSQAPPRTLLMEANGAKSQLAGLISCMCVLIVIVAIGPLFYFLPRALLAAVTFTAVCPIFRNFLDLRLYWNTNKWDIIVWLVTFLSVLLLDPFMAIAIGIGTNLFTMSLNAAFASAESLSLAESTEIFINQKMYKRVANFKGVKIFRFNGNICFLNVDNFKKQLFLLTVHPHEVKSPQKKLQSEVKPNIIKLKQGHRPRIEHNGICDFTNRYCLTETEAKLHVEEGGDFQRNNNEEANIQINEDIFSIHSVIIDCSRISFVDSNGIMCLRQLLEDYKAADIRLLLANCSTSLPNIIDKSEFQAVLFPSVFDAVMSVVDLGENNDCIKTKF